jgi:hypothetical protein
LAEIIPPTFLWHDRSETATRWVVEVSFADHSNRIRVEAAGEFMQVGESDSRAGDAAVLIPSLADARTWKPDAVTWEKIKRLSVKSPATITIKGFAEGDRKLPVLSGKVTIMISRDSVVAPIFYRNVPLTTPAVPPTPSNPPGRRSIWQSRNTMKNWRRNCAETLIATSTAAPRVSLSSDAALWRSSARAIPVKS